MGRVSGLLARARDAREAGDTQAYDEALFMICAAMEVPPPVKPGKKRRPLTPDERAKLEARFRSLGIME